MQEVVEELTRTNVPHLYLLTIDEQVPANVANTLKNHNITVVLFDSVKSEKFIGFDNIIGFKSLFDFYLPHKMEYWELK